MGLFDIAFNHPDPWSGSREYEANIAVPQALQQGRDILTEDFCLMGEHRFVRAILPLPLVGFDESFAFGVWGSVAPPKFLEYCEHFDGTTGGTMPAAFSWLMNRLPGAQDKPARARLLPQNDRQRPILEITDEDHPFFLAQTEGLTSQALLEIYAISGHRPLTQ